MSNTDSSKVTSFIEKKIKEVEENSKRSKGKERRFTVVLSEYDYKRLTYITNLLSEPKSALAREFIIGALDDAEAALNLTGWEKTPYSRVLLDDDDYLDEEEREEAKRHKYRAFMENSLDPLDEND